MVGNNYSVLFVLFEFAFVLQNFHLKAEDAIPDRRISLQTPVLSFYLWTTRFDFKLRDSRPFPQDSSSRPTIILLQSPECHPQDSSSDCRIPLLKPVFQVQTPTFPFQLKDSTSDIRILFPHLRILLHTLRYYLWTPVFPSDQGIPFRPEESDSDPRIPIPGTTIPLLASMIPLLTTILFQATVFPLQILGFLFCSQGSTFKHQYTVSDTRNPIHTP